MGSADLSRAWLSASSELVSFGTDWAAPVSQSPGGLLGSLHGSCRTPRAIKKQAPTCRHFSIYFCHICYSPIGQSKSLSLSESLCERRLQDAGGLNKWGCFYDLHTVLTYLNYEHFLIFYYFSYFLDTLSIVLVILVTSTILCSFYISVTSIMSLCECFQKYIFTK